MAWCSQGKQSSCKSWSLIIWTCRWVRAIVHWLNLWGLMTPYAIWWQTSESILAQVMAWCRQATSHYLNHQQAITWTTNVVISKWHSCDGTCTKLLHLRTRKISLKIDNLNFIPISRIWYVTSKLICPLFTLPREPFSVMFLLAVGQQSWTSGWPGHSKIVQIWRCNETPWRHSIAWIALHIYLTNNAFNRQIITRCQHSFSATLVALIPPKFTTWLTLPVCLHVNLSTYLWINSILRP